VDTGVSARAPTDFLAASFLRSSDARSRRLRRLRRPRVWYALFGLCQHPVQPDPRSGRIARVVRAFVAVLSILPAVSVNAQPETRHAVLRLRGDLDARETADAFVRALADLDARSPSAILIELTGNRSRPDLLFEAVRAVRDAESSVAVWLADNADRRVGPGMLAIALAADHAGIHPQTTIERTTGDDLTHLNPAIEDWAVLALDLRSIARDLGESGPLPRTAYESALAPRSSLWIVTDDNGAPTLSDDAPSDAPRLVERSGAGWSFSLDAPAAARLYRIGTHRTPRAFERSIGIRGRPLETVEIDSGLARAHERALLLVRQVRTAIDLADAALDVRAGRPGTTRIMPHEYRDAAEKAAGLVAPSRAAIAEIAALTDRYPEILQMPPPRDADAPTEIGGPARSRLSAWRDAVRDAEYDLSNLDDRIETYRRR
jgi:hypothetical protein